jgi:hypothetical protein
MAYDAPPNFASSEPFSAWWQVSRPQGFQICATQGRALVRAVRAAFALPATDTWDDALGDALAARAAAATDPSALAAAPAVRASRAARAVDGAALHFAIWYTYYRPYHRPFDGVRVIAPAAVPPWGTPPPNEDATNLGNAGDGILCWDPATENPLALGAELAALRARSSTGVLLAPGEAAPAAPPTPPSAVSTGTLIAIGVGFTALLVGVVLLENRRK